MSEIEGYAGRCQTSEVEQAKLIECLPVHGRMLEIGTFHGITAAIIARARPSATIHSVDPFVAGFDTKPGVEKYWRTNARENQELFICDAQEFLADGRKEWPDHECYDLVLVDGSHAHVDALIDLIVADCILRESGVIAAHDYAKQKADPRVRWAVEDFCKMRAYAVTAIADKLAVLERQG